MKLYLHQIPICNVHVSSCKYYKLSQEVDHPHPSDFYTQNVILHKSEKESFYVNIITKKNLGKKFWISKCSIDTVHKLYLRARWKIE